MMSNKEHDVKICNEFATFVIRQYVRACMKDIQLFSYISIRVRGLLVTSLLREPTVQGSNLSLFCFCCFAISVLL